MFASVLKRNLFTKRFWLLTVLAAFVMLAGESEKIKDTLVGESSYTALYIIFRTNLFCQTQAIVAAIMAGICALGFCEDRENGYYCYCEMRTSPFRYVSSWLIGNLVTVLIATFFVYFFMLLCLLIVMPITKSDFPYENNLAPYGEWVRGFPPVYILIVSLTEGCNYAFLSLLGMMVLVRYPDKYVAVGIPVILQQFLYWLSQPLPPFLNYYDISIAEKLFEKGPIFHLCYTLLYFGILYLFFGMQFMKSVEKNHFSERK